MPSKVENQQILLGEDYLELWVESFIQSKKAENVAKGTIVFYKDKLIPFSQYLESQEIKYISQITSNNIREYLLFLSEKGHNEGGIHGYFRAIKTFLRWYWDEVEPEGKNPISKVKAPKVTEEPLTGIHINDFESLLNECTRNTFYGERDRAVLLVLMETGIRASELTNINLEDVNLIDNSILIQKGKGRKPRYVFFGKTTRRQLRKYLQFRGKEGYALFINREGDRFSYKTLREVVRRLSRKAGIEEPGLHSFRRAFTIEQLRRGTDLLTISRLLGHTTLQLLSRYAKQTKGDLGSSYRSIVDD